MTIQSINLAWIIVKDLKSAIKFYTETVGLKLEHANEEFGWAELVGHEGGMRLGIGQQNDYDDVKPGSNAVVTLTVKDINASKKEMAAKGATMKGDILEIPGHVKLQSIVDKDGNHLQLVEVLEKK